MNLSLKFDLVERRSFLDPHSGRDGKGQVVKAGLARAAIVDVARDSYNRIFVLDAWADRVGTSEIIDRCAEHWVRWRPLQFGVDSTAQQNLFLDTANEILRLRGQSYVRLTGCPAHTHVDKIAKIRTILNPVVAERRLIIASHLVELKTELVSFPTGATVDIVDALAGAVAMFPSKISPREEREASHDLYREFLRECGLTDDEIESRIAEEPSDGSFEPFSPSQDN